MPNPENLSKAEVTELNEAFSDLTNYEGDDPCAPIDPVTYRAPDGDTCLHTAARRGNFRAAELLIKAGVDVNALGDMRYTPLHWATTPAIVELLLSNGADPALKNDFGQSPVGNLGWMARSNISINTDRCKRRFAPHAPAGYFNR